VIMACIEELSEYDIHVSPLLPTPPDTPIRATVAEDEDEAQDQRYVYITAYKETGNSLFKQGKYEWAIRTYVDGVDALASKCYASRERMLWDYYARGVHTHACARTYACTYAQCARRCTFTLTLTVNLACHHRHLQRRTAELCRLLMDAGADFSV